VHGEPKVARERMGSPTLQTLQEPILLFKYPSRGFDRRSPGEQIGDLHVKNLEQAAKRKHGKQPTQDQKAALAQATREQGAYPPADQCVTPTRQRWPCIACQDSLDCSPEDVSSQWATSRRCERLTAARTCATMRVRYGRAARHTRSVGAA
jgi:hypothetical protein